MSIKSHCQSTVRLPLRWYWWGRCQLSPLYWFQISIGLMRFLECFDRLMKKRYWFWCWKDIRRRMRLRRCCTIVDVWSLNSSAHHPKLFQCCCSCCVVGFWLFGWSLGSSSFFVFDIQAGVCFIQEHTSFARPWDCIYKKRDIVY